MKKIVMVAIATFLGGASLVADRAQAGNPYNAWAQQEANQQPWHGSYYYLPYGHPTALVVPPTAHMRQTYSWGVSQNLMYPLTHQFGRSATSPGAHPPGSYLPTPHWPSHTDQFGVYYVRGPW
jgi:hypothetical protein